MKLALEAGPDTLELAVELKISGVPVSGAELVKDRERALAPLQERQLTPCQVGAAGYNPLLDDGDRRAQEELLLALLDITPTLEGNPCIMISGGNFNPDHFGQTDPRNFQSETLQLLADRLKPLIEKATETGARISIEPYLKGAMDSPERCRELAALLGDPPALAFNLDPTSLYDYRDLVDSTSMVERVCRLLGPRAGLIHVKEVGLAKGFHLHAGLVPLGEGPTDWAYYLKESAAVATRDLWVLLEHCLSADEARNSVRLLRKAAEEAGVALD